ncbi:hypothetical protein EXIGLDRAFT_610465 [Exidia glandulosa HHB12029]|uniref:Uncharacterized protein n=1 Tax=Exidia glandulosa HHB12029 TaxID=1314781 RepID=A0A165JZC0_EXIGL|nr:hypothetical protein EXIGLDRAFT_610465 [Exidia glandulosa HHB12029]
MYRSSKDKFIEKLNTLLSEDPVLERFFEDDQNYIPELAMKAMELETDMTSALGSSELLPKTVKVTLYQQVIHYDSWLMNIDNRWAALAELVKRIAKITTRVLPEEEGVALRFANQAVDESPNLSLQQISNIFESRAWSLEGSATAIRSLQLKVLQPMVYSKLADRSLRRPLLVSLLVAGVPSDDMDFPLLYIIKDCGDKLQAAGYPRKSVKFMISQFGAADDATPFFSELRSNKEVADVVFVSSDPLDKRSAALEASETELDRWVRRSF